MQELKKCNICPHNCGINRLEGKVRKMQVNWRNQACNGINT